MSKVADLQSQEVIDYCANEDCSEEIVFGQQATKWGRHLYCNMGCLSRSIGAAVITVNGGGREDNRGSS
jgi:hypothetical protein